MLSVLQTTCPRCFCDCDMGCAAARGVSGWLATAAAEATHAALAQSPICSPLPLWKVPQMAVPKSESEMRNCCFGTGLRMLLLSPPGTR